MLAAVGSILAEAPVEVASAEQKNAIAVLPLQNMNGDFSVDYLRFALADELTSVLRYSRSLEVRPSSVTRRYVEQDLDPHKVGQQLHVGRLLTGHFLRQGEQLTVTLEAIDVTNDRLLWQGTRDGVGERFDFSAVAIEHAGTARAVASAGRCGGHVERGIASEEPGSLRPLPAQPGSAP